MNNREINVPYNIRFNIKKNSILSNDDKYMSQHKYSFVAFLLWEELYIKSQNRSIRMFTLN